MNALLNSLETPYDYVFLRTDPDLPGELHTLAQDPEDYVVHQGYEVCAVNFDNHAAADVVSTVDVQFVRLQAALNQGLSEADVMLAGGDCLQALHSWMYDDNGEYQDSFMAQVGDTVENVDICLLEECDDILDHHWGSQVLRSLAMHYGSTSGFLVMGVLGLNSDDGAERLLGHERADKLERMGFVEIEDSGLFALNLAYLVPELPEDLTLFTPAQRDALLALAEEVALRYEMERFVRA